MKIRSGYLRNQDSYCHIKVSVSSPILETYMRENRIPPDVFARITKEDERSYAVDLSPSLSQSLVRLLNWYRCHDMLDLEGDIGLIDYSDEDEFDEKGYHCLDWSVERLRDFIGLNAAWIDAEAAGKISYVIDDQLDNCHFWQVLTYGEGHGQLIWGPVAYNTPKEWIRHWRQHPATIIPQRNPADGHLDEKALWNDSYGETWDAPRPVREMVFPGDSLRGHTFFFTGTLTRIPREELKIWIHAFGGEYVEHLEDIGYLVMGENPDMELVRLAPKLEVEVIDEAAFFDMIFQ